MDYTKQDIFVTDYERRANDINGFMLDFLDSGHKSARVVGWDKAFPSFHSAYVGMKRHAEKFGIIVKQSKGNIYIGRSRK